MNDLIQKKSVYDLMRSIVTHRYLYESREFIGFMESGGMGFTLEALQAWREYLIKKGYKARTINKYLIVAKGIFRKVIETAGDDIPHGKREAILNAFNDVKRIKEPRPAMENGSLQEFEIKN